MRSHSSVHLPNLNIDGFRGIDHLSIPRLARVTLLAGKNGTGKTTVLDAVRAYAARGHSSVLRDILVGREEFSGQADQEGEPLLTPDWLSLFHGREMDKAPKIHIGPRSDALTIELTSLDDEMIEQSDLFSELLGSEIPQVIRIKIGETERFIPNVMVSTHFNALSPRITKSLRRWPRESERVDRSLERRCEVLGPGLLSNAQMAEFWDQVALTDDEHRTVDALKLVLGEEVDRVTVVGGGRPYSRFGPDRGVGRRALVKLKGYKRPVPLKSCGDGASRLFGVALALANSAGGFLLIDEAENGLHWSVERDFWRMVLKTAQENDVQVLATTHGWDCIAGFAQAVNETPEEDGLLLRLNRDGGQVRAVDYTEAQLQVAADQKVEVR